jgi:hypothetical protein
MPETQVTNPSAFQNRSLGKQVLFTIITFGIYPLYWFHITHKQLVDGTDANFNPTLRTVGLIIPIYNFVVLWRTSNDCEAVTDQSGAVLFLFNLVFPPIFWYLAQTGMNQIASR